MPSPVSDMAKQTPQTTYGITKAICELLINDHTRKGHFDGRSTRLPTVIIRPGKPFSYDVTRLLVETQIFVKFAKLKN